jgi:hypothetical protein
MGREPAIGTMYEAGTHRLPDLFRMGNRKESAHKIGDSWGWKTSVDRDRDRNRTRRAPTTTAFLIGQGTSVTIGGGGDFDVGRPPAAA